MNHSDQMIRDLASDAIAAAVHMTRPTRARLLAEVPTAPIKRRLDGTCEIHLAKMYSDTGLDITEDDLIVRVVPQEQGEVDWPFDMNSEMQR
ncbi:MAG: hypothetical protein ACMG6S_10475 [Byssovorax sp.]